MTQHLTTSTTANFEVDGVAVSISLEEDANDKMPPINTRLPTGGSVFVENSRGVKMFVDARYFSGVQVVAVTGEIAYNGTKVDKGKFQLLAFTPTSREQELPPGAFAITLEAVGRAYTINGALTTASFTYNAVTKKVRCNSSSFAFCTVKYDQAYYSYRYTFAGACPLKVEDSTDNDYKPGVVYGIYSRGSVATNASLNLSAPKCQYPGMGAYAYGNTANDKKLPTLLVQQDPHGTPKLVSVGEGFIAAQALFRVYVDDGFASVTPTTGFVWQAEGYYTEEVSDTLIFNNTSSASLSKPASSGVSFAVPWGSGRPPTLKGPGESIIDVTWDSNGLSYSNPVTRIVGPNEVVSVDAFGVATRASISATAYYTANFNRYGMGFGYSEADGQFMTSHVVAVAMDGRSGSLQLSPPDTGSMTRKLS